MRLFLSAETKAALLAPSKTEEHAATAEQELCQELAAPHAAGVIGYAEGQDAAVQER